MNQDASYMRNGLVQEGVWLQEGDVAIHAHDGERSKTRRVPSGVQGRVISAEVTTVDAFEFGSFVQKLVARVHLAVRWRIGEGDKLSGRHGNKGIVSIIVDDRVTGPGF